MCNLSLLTECNLITISARVTHRFVLPVLFIILSLSELYMYHEFMKCEVLQWRCVTMKLCILGMRPHPVIQFMPKKVEPVFAFFWTCSCSCICSCHVLIISVLYGHTLHVLFYGHMLLFLKPRLDFRNILVMYMYLETQS